MSLLSKIVAQAEFAAKEKAVRADIYTEEDGSTVVVKFKRGREKYMHTSDTVEVDWMPDVRVLEHQKRIYEEHRK